MPVLTVRAACSDALGSGTMRYLGAMTLAAGFVARGVFW